jgi:hypothetical protein
MTHASTGVLQGNVITLDNELPMAAEALPEGHRVRVIVEPLLPVDQQKKLLQEWADNGPQGPIED